MPTRTISQTLVWTAVLAGLYATSVHNYLLFHGLVEVFSAAVAFAMFAVVWNADRFLGNGYLRVVGVAYVFLGFLGLLHTLASPGMGVFAAPSDHANQLRIASRYLEAVTLLAAFGALHARRRPPAAAVFAVYVAVTGLVVAWVFWWRVPPASSAEGAGPAAFGVGSQYAACALLGVALALLYRDRERFDPAVRRLLALSIGSTIASGLCFAVSLGGQGPTDLAGHYFKVFSFYLLYRALVSTAIQQPYALIFAELKAKEEELAAQAVTDGLTGAFNRRASFPLLERALSTGRRNGEVLTVVYLDLDDLKEVNDRFGHAAGDATIRAFCDAARDATRQADSLCRLGGDEFLLILPQCSDLEARLIVGRLDDFLAVAPTRPGRLPIRFSWGIASSDPKTVQTPEELVERADGAMYAQKGRKRQGMGSGERCLAS